MATSITAVPERSGNYCDAELVTGFSSLLLICLKCGEIDAAEALWDWAEEWLDVDRDELEEELEIPDA